MNFYQSSDFLTFIWAMFFVLVMGIVVVIAMKIYYENEPILADKHFELEKLREKNFELELEVCKNKIRSDKNYK